MPAKPVKRGSWQSRQLLSRSTRWASSWWRTSRGQERDKADAPDLAGLRAEETQLVEGNRQLHHVAFRTDAAGRIPDRVPGEVALLAALGAELAVEPVALHPARVDAKFEATPRIVVGVQQDGDVVVLLDALAVAVGEVRADLFRLAVEGLEGDVEAVVVVHQAGEGAHRGRDAVARLAFEVQRDLERRSPGRLVEQAVDAHAGPVDARNEPRVDRLAGGWAFAANAPLKMSNAPSTQPTARTNKTIRTPETKLARYYRFLRESGQSP